MLILTIRTDKPEAELGLFDGDRKLAYEPGKLTANWPKRFIRKSTSF